MPWPGSSRTSLGPSSVEAGLPRLRARAPAPSTCADIRSTDAARRSSSPGSEPVAGHDLAHIRRADCERAGLVEQDRARLPERLDRPGALDDHARARGPREP